MNTTNDDNYDAYDDDETHPCPTYRCVVMVCGRPGCICRDHTCTTVDNRLVTSVEKGTDHG